MTSTTISLDDLAPLPTNYAVLAKADRKRYQAKHDDEATDYEYAVVTFIPRRRVTLMQKKKKTSDQQDTPTTTEEENRLVALLEEAKKLLTPEMAKQQSDEKMTNKEKQLRDGLGQAWRLMRDTLAPEKMQPRVMMMKIRDVFRTKKEALAALDNYYKAIDPHFDHMWVKVGEWDGFMDEDNALNMKIVNKDMYSSSHSIFQQVMSGWFQSIDQDRKGLEFRLWKDSAKTDMWRRLSRIKNTTGHEAPDETMQAIEEGKTLSQVNKESERKSLSETRVGEGGQKDDSVKSSEALFAQLANLAKHKKKTMASMMRRRRRKI